MSTWYRYSRQKCSRLSIKEWPKLSGRHKPDEILQHGYRFLLPWASPSWHHTSTETSWSGCILVAAWAPASSNIPNSGSCSCRSHLYGWIIHLSTWLSGIPGRSGKCKTGCNSECSNYWTLRWLIPCPDSLGHPGFHQKTPKLVSSRLWSTRKSKNRLRF